jgi:hypothetical protein
MMQRNDVKRRTLVERLVCEQAAAAPDGFPSAREASEESRAWPTPPGVPSSVRPESAASARPPAPLKPARAGSR